MPEQLSGYNPEAEEVEPMAKEKPIDALVVFGFGAQPRTKEEASFDPDRQQDKGWHLTVGSKARILAMGELWRMGEIDKIILSEGGTPDKEKSGGQLMKEYLLSKYPEIPEDKIVVEDKASNTIKNFAGTIDYLDGLEAKHDQEKKPKPKYAFLSNTFHMPRIQSLAHRFGINGQGFTAEDVLELAAQQREERTGIPTVNRYNIWRNRMSSPEGNDIWREENEVVRREYVGEINSLIAKAKKGEIRADHDYLIGLLSKTWSAERRESLDTDLQKLGIDTDALHQRIAEKIARLGKTSYRDYLRQENRWLGGVSYLPEYWLYQAAKVGPERFRKILQDPDNSDAAALLEQLGYHDVLSMSDEEFSNMKNAISSPQFVKDHRKVPPEEWENEAPDYNSL